MNLDNDQEEFPVLKAELEAEFPYGVLLITDAESTEQIPSWDSPEEPVAVAASALVVRVRHAGEGEGEVTVLVVDSPGDAAGVQIFAGELEVKSRVLKISDALSAATTEVQVT
ncbi:hypothetical protein OG558_19545 [Kribbella sp. NBC_01510]|uniref:hypothetical protein n=1 Tax=Kribbella sp. NBC_01510 TaxID=2903581 RepID=UPI00386CCF94